MRHGRDEHQAVILRFEDGCAAVLVVELRCRSQRLGPLAIEAMLTESESEAIGGERNCAYNLVGGGVARGNGERTCRWHWRRHGGCWERGGRARGRARAHRAGRTARAGRRGKVIEFGKGVGVAPGSSVRCARNSLHLRP